MNQIELQHAYRQLLARYENHFEYAVTLTLKQAITLHTEQTGSTGVIVRLTDSTLHSTLTRFTTFLTRYLYGNAAKRKATAKPLLIIVREGVNNDKREHLHIALGNVPDHKKADIEQLIKAAWAQCDFAHQQINVQPIHNATGWTHYITKEIGSNNDALDLVASTLPQIH
jgi:hypothetical protein